MILCVGEILADMIGVKTNGSVCYERKAGGAPFNVACAAKQFGSKTAFVGCVGNDLIGDFLSDFAKGRALDGGAIYRDENRNTTLAFVELDDNGERSFCFYRKNTADYHIPEIPEEMLAAADIVHIGSLMLNDEAGVAYAKALALRARGLGKTVSFDVNFRTDIFRDEEQAKERYREILALADVVKFSEDEVEIFSESYISSALADKLVCITLGGAGSEWRCDGQKGNVPSISVKPIDTTGAGDAFYGGILRGLDGVNRKEWTAAFLNDVFRFANVCGALNTLGHGAIDCLPTLEEVQKRI